MIDIPISTEELDEMEKRADAATPGPWGWMHDEDGKPDILNRSCNSPGEGHEGLGHTEDECCGDFVLACEWPDETRVCKECFGEFVDCRPSEVDALFLKHSRADIPRLIAEVRRLRKELRYYDS